MPTPQTGGILVPIFIICKLLQPLNVFVPILFTFKHCDMSTSVRLSKSPKAPYVSLSCGSSISVNCEPCANLTELNDEQPLNTEHPMVSTLAGISISFKDEHPVNIPVGSINLLSFPYSSFNLLPSANLTDVKDLQSSNARYSIDATDAGITIDCSLLSAKVSRAINSKPSGKTIDVILLLKKVII